MLRLFRLSLYRAFYALCVASLIAACGGSAAPASDQPAAKPADTTSSEASVGGELVVGIEGDIVAVDPAFAYDFTANPVVCEITEGLLKFKDGETLEPNLAEKWENPDPLTYIYHIRQGVTFQDGSPMTIDDRPTFENIGNRIWST